MHPLQFLFGRQVIETKGSHENNFPSLGAETPVWQGRRTAHTPRYGKDEQRRQTGWIDAQAGEVIFARALRTFGATPFDYLHGNLVSNKPEHVLGLMVGIEYGPGIAYKLPQVFGWRLTIDRSLNSKPRATRSPIFRGKGKGITAR